jgi:GNAT superfamily N-acetyltransferase
MATRGSCLVGKGIAKSSIPGSITDMSSTNTFVDLEIRQADRTDVDAIAEAHRQSIESLGPAFYSPTDVEAWKQGLSGEVYLKAMDAGEVFFIATGKVAGAPLVLGFASDYRIEGTTHGTSVYVRDIAARRGIGTALLRRAEEHAVANGARMIQIEASLAGRDFYRANRYIEVGRGETRLMLSGYSIASVLMRKEIGGVETNAV